MLLTLTLHLPQTPSISNPLQPLITLPKNVDLRSLGLVQPTISQDACAASFALVMTAAFSNAILLTQLQQPDFWQLDANSLRLSAQYTLSNTRGQARYCDGGAAAAGVNFAAENFQTVEIEQNYPFDPTKYVRKFYKGVDLVPVLEVENWNFPVKKWQLGSENVSLINLNSGGRMDQGLVREYLARGISVMGRISVGGKIFGYDGKIAVSGVFCDQKLVQKDILIVGYGWFKGVAVWVVQNSFGPQWGSHGFFYVQAGENNLCIENAAYAVIPVLYDEGLGVFSEKFSSAFKIKRGVDGLDNDDGSFKDLNGLSSIVITLIVIISLVVACLMLGAGILIASRVKRTKSQLYFQLSDQQQEAIGLIE